MRKGQYDPGRLSTEPKTLMSFDDDNRMLAAHTQKCELVDEVLRVFGTVRLRVTGFSMLPSVWPGDTLIILRRNIEGVAVGDIVLYCREARLFAHRVISRADSPGKPNIFVQGDALPAPDGLILWSEILGTVSRIIRNGRYLEPSTRLRYYERLIGSLISRSQSLARVVVFIHSICSSARCREAW
jgi:hypothetical protein